MAEFNPLSTSEELKELYKNYISTTFPIKNSVIRSNFEDLIDSDRVLWNGPFVSITSKYKRGGDARKFLEECRFHQSILRSLKLDSFYKHQEDAIRLISQQEHLILSTGTGSGKTEAFLLPILDYCLKHREKGIKAIIVYPMNALANDQMLRLRTFLYAINSQLQDPVTFARYTGQTPQDDSERNLGNISERCRLETNIIDTSFFSSCAPDCDQQKLRPKMMGDVVRLTCPNNLEYSNNFELLTRQEMKRSPPDILITNYVQLEYLLLRREDAPIFRSPSFRFLVFDEIHYYAGATGAEVALLIRRLKARLKEYSKKKVICVGTSATISSTGQAKKDISQFASLLFGEEISANNVVIGENEPADFKGESNLSHLYSFSQAPLYSPEQIVNLNNEEFIELCAHFSKNPKNQISPDQRLAYIGSLLASNDTFAAVAKLIQDNPKPVSDICQELTKQSTADYPEDEIEQLIWSYLHYGGISYDPNSYSKNRKEPLIRAQIHLFFKTLGDRWPSSGLFACMRCLSVYTKPYDKCKSCGGIIEELGTCRECGAEFYRSVFQENPADNSINALSTIGKENTVGFSRLGYNDDGYKVWQSPAEHGAPFNQYQKCLACGSLSSLDSISCQICASHSLHLVSVSAGINKCPYCGRMYMPGADIVTPFYVSPNVTSRLIFDLNHSLLPKGQRKMIVFTDSRQDASFMAGTIGEEHLTHLLRQILTALMEKSDETSFERLLEAVLHEIQNIDPTYTGRDIKHRILSEMASAVGKRRSVENLGLVTFDYTGIWSVDTHTISAEYNIDDDTLKRFIIAILNEMRLDRALYGLHSSKIRRLPPHGFVCARGVLKTKYIKNLISKRGRYVQYTRKVFPTTDALRLLESVFEILKQNEYLREVKVRSYEYSKDSENGYVIDADKIRFKKPNRLYSCDTCQRVYSTVPDESCAAWNCQGHLKASTPEEYYQTTGNFYTSFYKDRSPSRLKVREDTGYLRPTDRQKLELAFRAGNLDMLVATPTLELGIDIGDVTSIGLMKAPPSPAKYVQRVGRAGRVSKVSMTLNTGLSIATASRN